MSDGSTSVGIDAHKKDLQVAMLVSRATAPVTWTVANEPRAIARLWRKLEQQAAGPVVCCYEAGGCGYGLQRQLQRGRVQCQVIAPALSPRKAGDHIKTDRRDARKLAELLRAGLLTEVQPPTPADEAARDLVRARDDARADVLRCRHRLGKRLRRRSLHYPGRNWTAAHRLWLRSLSWEHAAEQRVVADYLLALDQGEARLAELDAALAELASSARYRDAVGWLRCFRGIDTLTAIVIVADLYDVRRFRTPRALMSYLGLVPGEHSSGEHTRRGPITKAGNTLVRRILVEAAWHYQHRAGIGPALARRRTGQPARVVAIADKAQQRLCRRFRRLVAAHKPTPNVAVAVARELSGFVWAALQPEVAA